MRSLHRLCFYVRPDIVFKLQIKSSSTKIRCAPFVLETQVFDEAMSVADRVAAACRRTGAARCDSTWDWVVEIIGETGGIFYCAPVAQA
jgi:hypothetical protein